ncbi:hypothetical protein FJT64_002444 [Amphibalanus amphitrite]|uniref:Uncharacterized protein n=1 Tax=Amphibalanus amphitrite TaxID=1232801 RepID=A0A6A4WVQ6_AMPAM|nr:hypothetical protein FJT64_002444 [Amphibalanus amphitrite]
MLNGHCGRPYLQRFSEHEQLLRDWDMKRFFPAVSGPARRHRRLESESAVSAAPQRSREAPEPGTAGRLRQWVRRREKTDLELTATRSAAGAAGLAKSCSEPAPFEPPVAVQRTRGRAAGGGVVKGGDIALYLRAGLQFAALTCPLLHPNDDSTETAPDLIACSDDLARRATWHLGPDLGSDHLPMVAQVATSNHGSRCIRKPRWSFKKADWAAFQAECEAAFEEAEPSLSTQELSTLFVNVLHQASVHHIPRGARADPKPWALDPELREAIAERREARRLIRRDDPSSKARWVEAKRRAASVERRVTQAHFRDFVGTTLNKPASLGKVAKILKKWEGAPDDHRPGEAMEDGDRLLVTDAQKASAFNRTYAHVSREKRSVEDNLGRLIQEVQDGWNRPRSRRLHTPDGQSAQKFVLLAFDFSRAYDTVDHRLLRARLLDQGLPRCFVRWVWQFIRDRRACLELNGTRSSERI